MNEAYIGQVLSGDAFSSHHKIGRLVVRTEQRTKRCTLSGKRLVQSLSKDRSEISKKYLRNGDEDDDGLFTASDVGLLGGSHVEITQLSLHVAVHLQV